MFNFIIKYKVIIYLLLIDIFIISLHILFSESNTYYDLDQESNLPTFYQSVKLIVFGIYVLYKSFKDKYNAWFFSISSIIFIYIGVDEILMIHENFPEYANNIIPGFAYNLRIMAENYGYKGAMWVAYALILIFFSMPFLIYEFIHVIKNYKYNTFSVAMISLGVALFFGVLLIEGYATTGELTREEYNFTVIIEESFEKIGASLLLFAYFNWKKPIKIDVMKYLR